ncbi:hypothetical protein AB7M49_003242 [Bradyrhizobium elkanii]
MTPANDNQPLSAGDFTDLAARRAWLQSAPATHATHHEQSPCVTWAKREKDETPLMGIRLWRSLNEPPRMAANDNEPDEDATEGGEKAPPPNLDRELIDVSAKQLIYANDRG